MITRFLLDDDAPHVVLVGSGKGGVGKSLLSILLAAEAASAGRRVLLFDADLSLGTLHVLLGLRPAARVDALLDSPLEPDDLVCRVSRNLWLLPGTCGVERLHDLSALERARLELRLSAVFSNYDLVIVGTPVWASNVSTPVRTYLSQNRGLLPRVAFFCTMGGRGSERALRKMEEISGARPVARLALRERVGWREGQRAIQAFVEAAAAAVPEPPRRQDRGGVEARAS